jgi:hypothetical protein
VLETEFLKGLGRNLITAQVGHDKDSSMASFGRIPYPFSAFSRCGYPPLSAGLMKLTPDAIKIITEASIGENTSIEFNARPSPGRAKKEESRCDPPGEKPDRPVTQETGDPYDRLEKESLHSFSDGISSLRTLFNIFPAGSLGISRRRRMVLGTR